MAKQVPTREPRELTIGSAWSWDATHPDFRADESWELRYYLRGADDFDLTFGTHVTAGDGAEFEVRVTAAQSAAGVTKPGKYRMVGQVFKTGDKFDGTVVYSAHLLVLADPVTAVNVKSTNRQILEAIDVALVAGVTNSAEVKRLTINGRTIEYRDGTDLEGRRAHYMLLVAEEENPGGVVRHEWEVVRG